MTNRLGAISSAMDRRGLLTMIGTATSAAVMYQAMDSLGHAAQSDFDGPIKLEGNPKGASVIILGAGLAGMTAALELRKAGYKVKILEYRERAGGRSWTLRGGDRLHRAGRLHPDLRFRERPLHQPGPVAHSLPSPRPDPLCKTLGVKLEPFVELNANALLHNSKAFGDASRERSRHIMSDFNGYVSELLSKATNQGKLDEAVTKEDREIILEALKTLGRARQELRLYAGNGERHARLRRGPGGGA